MYIIWNGHDTKKKLFLNFVNIIEKGVRCFEFGALKCVIIQMELSIIVQVVSYVEQGLEIRSLQVWVPCSYNIYRFELIPKTLEICRFTRIYEDFWVFFGFYQPHFRNQKPSNSRPGCTSNLNAFCKVIFTLNEQFAARAF